MALNDVAAGRV